jgi:hypothetical protein
MWLVFKRSAQDWARYVPGYFLEINPTWYRYGLGFYDAAPNLMARFRQQIDENPESFLKAVAWFAKQDVFSLEGERYKRSIGQDKPEPIRTCYGCKSFYLTCNRRVDKAILSPKFAHQLMKHFGMAAPLYHISTASPPRSSANEVDGRHKSRPSRTQGNVNRVRLLQVLCTPSSRPTRPQMPVNAFHGVPVALAPLDRVVEWQVPARGSARP